MKANKVKPKKKIVKRVKKYAVGKKMMSHEDEASIRFTRAVYNAPFPVMIYAEDGEILLVNKMWCELSGYSNQDMKSIEIWVNKAFNQQNGFTKSYVDKLYSLDHKVEEGDYVVTTKSGNKRVWSFNSAPLSVLDDGRRTVITMATDITERKLAEKEVKDSAWRLHAVIEKVGDGITVSDMKGHFEIFNSKMEEITGYTIDEANERDFSTLIYPDNKERSAALSRLDGVARGSNPEEIETVIRAKDGLKKTLLVSSSVIWYKNAEMYLSVYRDITSAKRSEEKIKKAVDEWNRTFNAISDFVFIQDKDFTIIKINKALCDYLKLSSEQIIGKKCYEVMHKLAHPWPTCPFERTLEDNLPHTQEVEDPVIGIPLLITTSPILDDKGDLIGNVHIAKDITDRKKIEHLKDEFVSTVSHELRTPLSIIKEGVSLILDRIVGDINNKQEEFLKIASNNIDRLARIINNLLDISKIESGKMELHKDHFDISALARSVVKSFESKAKVKKLELKLNIQAEGMSVHADMDRLTQVFTNLIDNAIKFTDEGTVDITIKELPNKVECIVADTGIGIAKENITDLFNKFRQFGRKAGPGEKGTGLGLSIVKGIILMHHGDIWVESNGEKGSKFIFTLPKNTGEALIRSNIHYAIEDAAKKGSKLSVISVTVAGFDKVQTVLSPKKIHALLQDLKNILSFNLRQSGDVVLEETGEVIVILPKCDRDSASKVIERITIATDSYLESEGMEGNIKLIFGMATYPADGKNEEELMHKVRETSKT